MYKLFLDDIREPKTNGWVIARSYDEFVRIIKKRGIPYEISFDHDLGYSDEKTGYDCAKWLIGRKIDTRKITINVHSANPVGALNIRLLIQNWNKFLTKYE